MTAPLTPHDSPFPPPPDGRDPGPAEGPGTLRDVRDGVITAVATTVCGVALGLLWVWLAPRVPLISDGTAVYLKDSEGEQAIGADGWFTLLSLGFGALAAAVAFWRRRGGGVPLVIGLAAGGLLAAVVGWRLGVWLGPTGDVVAHARQVGVGKVFYAPLQLRAKGALLAWPIASMAAFAALTSAFGPRDPQVEPHWDGWTAS